MATATERVIEAAGGVVWRPAQGGLGVEIALVHRPKYDDWSIPKGKLLPDEHPLVGALRETDEETGFVGHPGRGLGEIRYMKDGTPKRVRYWSIAAIDGDFIANAEVDQVMWLPPREAMLHLSHGRDERPIIEEFMRDVRPTTPYVIARHGSAGERATWSSSDRERPLDDLGHAQALALAPVLHAIGVRRVLSADVLRCLDTVGPFAAECKLTVESEPLLSESGFLAAPDAAADRVLAIIADAEPAVLCSQGKAIPPLLKRVCDRLGGPTWDGSVTKGGFVVLHIADDEPRLVGVDRYPAVTSPDR
jgi:8-oxo-dGTP pyrophosphatase MutT (NUDIX family)/phosphohistidine phosphatase SixA